MMLSLKRDFLKAESTCSNSDDPVNKRLCLQDYSASPSRLCAYKFLPRLNRQNLNDASSSEDDQSSDDYSDSSRISKPKCSKRKHKYKSMVITQAPLDSKLTKAVSQYSDDDDDPATANKISHQPEKNRQLILKASKNENCKSNSSTTSFSKKYSVNTSDLMHLIPNHLIDGSSICKTRHFIPDSDFAARSRCFDYLVGAIDEAWARYCDATSYDEDIAYGYDNDQLQAVAETPGSNSYSSDDDEGYKSEFSATTSVTEYDSDFPQPKPRTMSMINHAFNVSSNTNSHKSSMNEFTVNRRVSEVPENVRLQQLKDRLIKAKYFLQDYVDSENAEDCIIFWKKWDLMKYSTIELIEDDDDDDVVEQTIEELEKGRYISSLCA